MTVDGPTLQVLREEWRVGGQEYRDRGMVPKYDDGTAETQDRKVRAEGEKRLDRDRKKSAAAFKGVDRSALPADVVPKFRAGRGQLYGVQYNGLEPPPGEERELYETPQEAHAVATRWREFWDRERDPQKAAKERRGGVQNVDAHRRDDDLFCVRYLNKHKGKSRFVREPGTGGSWYYDWDAALDLKADYEKSNKDASWFVSATEVKAAGKANQVAAGAKGRASQKRKR